jgi:hypothetical protein
LHAGSSWSLAFKTGHLDFGSLNRRFVASTFLTSDPKHLLCIFSQLETFILYSPAKISVLAGLLNVWEVNKIWTPINFGINALHEFFLWAPARNSSKIGGDFGEIFHKRRQVRIRKRVKKVNARKFYLKNGPIHFIWELSFFPTFLERNSLLSTIVAII